MSQITIYHGSPSIIEKPIFGAGNPRNDYGSGFYCTKDIELAKEWACNGQTDGYANEYSLDMTNLKVYGISSENYNILNWLALLLQNRHFRVSNDVAGSAREYLLAEFKPNVEDADVLVGYRANDSYFSYANSFLNSLLSLEQLETAMYLGNLGEQMVLKSEKAFSQLHHKGFHVAASDIYYPKRSARDKKARQSFQEQRSLKQTMEAVYILDIIRGEWKNDDSRLRRNISK
jgi:hypothetical protein